MAFFSHNMAVCFLSGHQERDLSVQIFLTFLLWPLKRGHLIKQSHPREYPVWLTEKQTNLYPNTGTKFPYNQVQPTFNRRLYKACIPGSKDPDSHLLILPTKEEICRRDVLGRKMWSKSNQNNLPKSGNHGTMDLQIGMYGWLVKVLQVDVHFIPEIFSGKMSMKI